MLDDDAGLGRREFLGTSAGMALAGQLAVAQATPPSTARKTILAIGAHLDDSECGAAGFMFNALNAGHRVVIVQAVSDYSNWPPTQGHAKEVDEGVRRVAQEMGVEKIFLGYKYHEVPVDLEIKRRIAQIVTDVNPDIALIMSEHDHWTDHTNIARAAKDGILFAHGYLGKPVKTPAHIFASSPSARQTFEFHPDTFVDITDVIDRVAWLLNSLNAVVINEVKHIAQHTLYGPIKAGYPKKLELSGYAELVLTNARRWGQMAGARYADAFQSVLFEKRELL